MAQPVINDINPKTPLCSYSFLRCPSCATDFISYNFFLSHSQDCVPKTSQDPELFNSNVDLNKFLDNISVLHKISF